MAMTTSERPIPTGEGLTFEKVWATIQEIAREDEKRRAEREAEQKKAAEEDEKRRAEREAEQKKAAERQKKIDRQIKRLNEQMGGLHNSFGKMAEHLVAPSIHERFNELGYHFNATAGGYKVFNEKGKVLAQVDIHLENSDYIIAVEVKATVRYNERFNDIEKHIKRLEILREHWNKRGDKRVIRGAIAGAIFGEMEKKATIEAGFYVIVQSGDTLKLELPEGFVPREF